MFDAVTAVSDSSGLQNKAKHMVYAHLSCILYLI